MKSSDAVGQRSLNSVAALQSQIEHLKKELAKEDSQKDRQILALHNANAERDRQIQIRNEAIEQKDAQIRLQVESLRKCNSKIESLEKFFLNLSRFKK